MMLGDRYNPRTLHVKAGAEGDIMTNQPGPHGSYGAVRADDITKIIARNKGY
jgi:hypothetical protein